MSWTLDPIFAKKKGADFDAAVEAADAKGQKDAEGNNLPGVDDQVKAAKAALKLLAPYVKRDNVSAGASGHALQEGEGENWSDSVNVWVAGTVQSGG